MRKLVADRPWLAAFVAWVLATVLVSAAYGAWLLTQGEPFHWDIVRDAALYAAPVALVTAWRDSRRRRE